MTFFSKKHIKRVPHRIEFQKKNGINYQSFSPKRKDRSGSRNSWFGLPEDTDFRRRGLVFGGDDGFYGYVSGSSSNSRWFKYTADVAYIWRNLAKN